MTASPRHRSPPAKLLLAIFDARDEWQGEPLHEALVRVLERTASRASTILQGLTGYGAHRGVHPQRTDRSSARQTTAILVVDNEASFRRAAHDQADDREGIVVLADAEVIPLP